MYIYFLPSFLTISITFKVFNASKEEEVSRGDNLTFFLKSLDVNSVSKGIKLIKSKFVFKLITSINSFSESVLGIIYREKDEDVYKGGPAFYIYKGLGNKKLANFYAFLIMFSYIIGFMTIQANTIVASII